MRNEFAGSTSADGARDRAFLEGGGRMGALMRSHDWSNSPLGAPETWPQSLRAIVALLLHSKFPMFVAWGKDLGFLYNDPYAEILGAKHPLSLGARFYDIWSEIWPDISPLIDAALSGEANYREDLPLVMNRKGYDEQTWFTFSYSPVRDETGRIAGMFCACTETTERKKAEDELRQSRAQIEAELTDTKLLQDLSAQMIHEADTAALHEKVVDAAMAIMRSDFASMQMLYPERGQAGELRLLTFRGFNPQAAKFWEWVGVDSAGSTCGAALRAGRRVIAPDVETCDFMADTEDLRMFRQTGIRACQTTPLRSRSGRMVGMISTHWRQAHQPSERELRLLDVVARQAADIIESGQAVAALRDGDIRLNEAQRIAHIGSWEWDAATDRNIASDELCRIFGLAVGRPIPDFKDQDGRMYPHESWVRLNAAVQETLRTGIGYELDLPALRNGEPIWITARSEVQRDHDGRTTGLRGTVQDISERKRAEEALRHRAAQHETLLNQSPLGVYLVDAEFRIREVNPVALPTFGDIRNLVGRDFDDVIHILWEKNYADEIVRAFRHTLATGEPYVTLERSEHRVDRNTTEHYEWRLDRITLPDGRFGVVCHFRDIAAQVQARQTQQLLIEELNHRVKNTLASVQAIVQHTLRSARDPIHFASSFSGRIQSMARAHSLLTSTVWKGADLRDVIRDQLQLGPIDESRLTAWGPAVRMPPQMVQHVALMLHELGTNSAKYGALSTEKGWVTINWTVEDALLRLKWVERGGPPVSAPIKRGFGTTLIEQSARSEGGDAHMSIDASGITWEITIPLPANVPALAAADTPQMVHVAAPDQAPAAERSPALLAGSRFLVIEDEPLVSMDLIAGLEEAGAEVVGTAGTSEEALALIEGTPIDAAMLDGNLRGRPVDDIAAALTRHNIPFVFVTGYGHESLPRAFGNTAILSKPFSREQLLEAATQLVGPPAGAVRLRRGDG
jgi:PAS domain S-box-containing protein